MKNARAARAIHNARPIVRAVLTTTAIAWSLGVQLPQLSPRPTVLAQSIGISAPEPTAATHTSSQLPGISPPSDGSASRRA